MTTSQPKQAAARKGDLVVVERTRTDFVIGQPSTTRTDYEIGVVASATRDGIVKTWQSVGWGDELLSSNAQPIRHDRCMVASRSAVDIEATLRAAKAHHWPNHPSQPRPFDSLDAVRTAVVRIT